MIIKFPKDKKHPIGNHQLCMVLIEGAIIAKDTEEQSAEAFKEMVETYKTAPQINMALDALKLIINKHLLKGAMISPVWLLSYINQAQRRGV